MKRASSSQDQKLLQILQEMESSPDEYPEELLRARRASFLDQVAQSTVADTAEPLSLQEQKLVENLKNLGSVPVKYPPLLLAIRRSVFVYRIAWLNFVSLCAAVWQGLQKQISVPAFSRRTSALRKAFPTYVLTASLALAAYVGYLFFESQGPLTQPSPPQVGVVQSGRIMKSDSREVRIICKPGAEPPLCLAGEFKKDNGLTFQGNGLARPAVSKDTVSDSSRLHKAANINDGMYGPGASWISNSKNSWIKIDLGKATEFNTVTFGRDRLGKLSGHDPGQFVIALAMTDNVYADGNSSDDYREYQLVFNSKSAGFSGKIAGADTVVAQFTPQKARFVKITFENKGAAIDEVEVYNMKQSSAVSSPPDKSSRDKDKDESPASTSDLQANNPISPPSNTVTSMPMSTATSIPTVRVIPSNTPTSIPTVRVIPSNTPTSISTATDVPTNTTVPTSTDVPTSTSVPPSTPTDVPSDTPLPPPTNTQAPPDTATSEPTEVPTQADISTQVDYNDYLTSYPPIP